jgi:rhamnosyltransferase
MTNLICATVILYNPIELILSNINSYINKVDLLIIVDNSEIQNIELIKTIKTNHSNILYIQNYKNLGVAKALNIACQKAIEFGYSFILTMDQDSRFDNFSDYLELINNIESKDIAIFSPQIIDEKRIKYLNNNIENTDFVITSGSILNLNLFNVIGEFNNQLFIDEVDHEYCAKALLLDYKILKLNNINLLHTIGDTLDNIGQHNFIRRYYITRNSLYMYSKYGDFFPLYNKKNTLKKIRKAISRIIRIEDNKIKKLISVCLGINDFIFKKYGERNFT